MAHDRLKLLTLTERSVDLGLLESAPTSDGNKSPSTVIPSQIRAARLLLGWSQHRLGAESGLPGHTVPVFERTGHAGESRPLEQPFNGLTAIRTTLEAAGVEFGEEGRIHIKAAP